MVKKGKYLKTAESWMVADKGKGDALKCNFYRGTNLLDHAMKVCDRVVEARLIEKVYIDEMQFDFMAGKNTTDAIFIVR